MWWWLCDDGDSMQWWCDDSENHTDNDEVFTGCRGLWRSQAGTWIQMWRGWGNIPACAPKGDSLWDVSSLLHYHKRSSKWQNQPPNYQVPSATFWFAETSKLAWLINGIITQCHLSICTSIFNELWLWLQVEGTYWHLSV